MLVVADGVHVKIFLEVIYIQTICQLRLESSFRCEIDHLGFSQDIRIALGYHAVALPRLYLGLVEHELVHLK